jgi:hypothetical protein
LGKEAVASLYYAIEQRYNLPKEEFERKPLEIIQRLRT